MKRIPQLIRQKPGVAIMVTVYSIFAILYYFPPHYTLFEFQRTCLALGEIIIGVVVFPNSLFTLFSHGIPWEIHVVVGFVYFIAAGFLVGKIFQKLWRMGWLERIAILAALIANGAFGLFAIIWGDVLVEASPAKNCERFITDQAGLRIAVFDETGVLPGAQFFYLFTTDSGKTWEQLMSVANNHQIAPECNTIAASGNHFVWVWSDNGVRTTQDGGKTWNKWDLPCCAYARVENVVFQDDRSGWMKVSPSPWGSTISELITSDGGRSWVPGKQ